MAIPTCVCKKHIWTQLAAEPRLYFYFILLNSFVYSSIFTPQDYIAKDALEATPALEVTLAAIQKDQEKEERLKRRSS